MRPLVARNHFGLGRLYRLAGERAQAEEHLASAISMLGELDMRFWFKRAAEELATLGQLIVVSRRHAELAEYLGQQLSGDSVTVVLDRRRSERRVAEGPHDEERRRDNRRGNPDVDATLESRGFVVIPPVGKTTGPDPGA